MENFVAHNHGREDPSFFPEHRKITSPVKRIISDTLADGAPSSTAIKKVRQCNSAYKEQDVYNYISLHINSDNRRLTPWQSLQSRLRKADDQNDLRYETRLTSEDEVTAVFITSDSCIGIYRAYPFLIQMDRTFNLVKVNNVSFLNITVEDCCGKQRIVAIALMAEGHSKESDYAWILEQVKTFLLGDSSPCPHVIGVDHELALYNALENSGLCSYTYLCRRHMVQAIKAAIVRALPSAADDDLADDILARVQSIIEAKTVDLLFTKKAELAATPFAKTHTAFMSYLHDTWYVYEKSWADAYRNQHRHYGWSTTNGVEGMQATIKRHLSWEPKSFTIFIDRLIDLFQRQKTNFTQMMSRQSATPRWITKNTGSLLTKVIPVASHTALKLIYQQFTAYMNAVRVPLPECTGFFRRCHGLPCAHEIADHMRVGTSIPVVELSGKWTVERPLGHETWICAESTRVYSTFGCRKLGLGGRFESRDDRELRQQREDHAAEKAMAKATEKAEAERKKAAKAAAASAARNEAAVRKRAQRDAETSARQAILDRCPCGENPRPARILVSEEVNWIACGGCEQWYHTCCELPSRCNEKVKKNAPAYECNKCRCTRGNHRRDPGRFVEEYCLDCGVYF